MLRYRKFCSNTFALDNLTREMNSKTDIRVRRVRAADIPQIIALDARVTKLAKADYWNDVFDRYGRRRLRERFFSSGGEARGTDGAACGWFYYWGNSRMGVRLESVRVDICAVGRAKNAPAKYRNSAIWSDRGRIQEGGNRQDANNGGE
jgi:hypothetical protein